MPLWKVLFSFGGRSPRSTFWYYAVLYAAMYFLFLWSYRATGTADASGATAGLHTALLCVSDAVLLVGTVSALAVAVKRCHDRNHSVWFVVVGLMPLLLVGAGWLVLVQLGLLRGNVGENQYGPDPLTAAPAPSGSFSGNWFDG